MVPGQHRLAAGNSEAPMRRCSPPSRHMRAAVRTRTSHRFASATPRAFNRGKISHTGNRQALSRFVGSCGRRGAGMPPMELSASPDGALSYAGQRLAFIDDVRAAAACVRAPGAAPHAGAARKRPVFAHRVHFGGAGPRLHAQIRGPGNSGAADVAMCATPL